MTRRLQKNRPKLLAPVHLSEIDAHNCRCQFRAFQRELQILGTKKFEIGPVVEKLHRFENLEMLPILGHLAGKSRNRSLITESWCGDRDALP